MWKRMDWGTKRAAKIPEAALTHQKSNPDKVVAS